MNQKRTEPSYRYLLNIFKWIDNRIIRSFERLVISSGLISMSIIVFAVVISRTFLGFSPAWSDELPRYIMVWVTFIGMSYCVRKGAHVSMDVLFTYLNSSLKRYLQMLICIVGSLFSIYLAYLGWELCQKLIDLNQRSVTLGIPIGYIYLVIPIGFILLAKNFAHLFYINLLTRDMQTALESEGEES